MSSELTGGGRADAPAEPPAELPARRSVRRSRLRRRLSAVVRLVAALTIVGGLYTGLAPGITQADDEPLSAAAEQGKRLYDNSCITCHGPGGEGVDGRGPSLVGVGEAAVEFQVTSGRMPLTRQEAQGQRKPPHFTYDQARQLAAYIQEIGGGPEIPGGNLRATGDEALARGGELYRINCSACHTFGGGGGALSSGKYAPSVKPATDRQIYAAMLTGPQNMPVFGDNQLTPDEKRAIIAYIQSMDEETDPGGFNLGRLGPVPEALVIFLVGMVALIFATLWIAGKS